MDLQMPNMDGYEATIHIRKQMPENKRNIPIIAMTAHVLEGVSEKCLSLGMNDCISKPINTSQLTQTINRLLKKRGETTISNSPEKT